MGDKYYIKMFLRFGSEEHATALIKSGTIFMNPIQKFREIEDDELRGDKYEGISEIINNGPGDFEIPALNFKGKYQKLHLRQAYDNVLGNIYSLYCISSHGWKNPADFYIDKRITKFGTHCVVIKDNPQFIERITESLKKVNAKFYHGFVDYYDKDVENRKITLFEKPKEFEYQKEFRFYVHQDIIQPYVFSIGNIEDIAELHLATDVINGISVDFDSVGSKMP